MDRMKRVASGRVIKKAVFRSSNAIYCSLSFQPLLSRILHPKLNFLTRREIELLHNQSTEYKKAYELLLILNRKGALAHRKFIACLRLEDDHRGHVLLAKSIMRRLSPTETEKVNCLVALVQSDTPVSSTRSSPAPDDNVYANSVYRIIDPDKPMPLIHLVGDLDDEEFLTLDRKFWHYFSTGDYSSLDTVVRRVGSSPEAPSDWKIVAMWFQALIVMHRDNNYDLCIAELLQPALDLCSDTDSENKIILEGRIYQRMAQIYLVMKRKDLAQMHFDKAKQQLQHVGRGYDKANMFCREAKLLSATSMTLEERDYVERLFSSALECITEDAPYALASRPSLILSKAAFHLHISFGAAPREGEKPPEVSTEDIRKARETLDRLDEKEIMLSMRKCENRLLTAELLRVDGKFDQALEVYEGAVQQSENSKLRNIVETAKSRISYIMRRKKNASVLEACLSDLP